MLRKLPFMRAAALLGALTATALTAPATVSGAVIAAPTAATPISAYGGYVAWSQHDPERGRFRLLIRDPAGGVAPAPVAGQRAPFDVDLGPGPSGRPTAVYSRCRRPPSAQRLSGLDDYASARDCRIYRLALPTGAERRVDIRPLRSAFAPTIWRDRIAFAAWRRHPRQQHIYERRLNSHKPARTRRRGPAPNGFGELLGQDLRGRSLAFSWRYSLPPGESFPADDRVVHEVRVDRHNAPQRLIARITLGPESTTRVFTTPTINRGLVTFAQAAFAGSSHNALNTYRLRDRRLRQQALPRPTIASATDARHTYLLQGTDIPADTRTAACRPIDRIPQGCQLISLE